jgi:hypothetical protein
MQSQGLFHRGNPRATDLHSQGRTAAGGLGEGDRTAKVSRQDGQGFDRATRMSKNRKLPNEEFK